MKHAILWGLAAGLAAFLLNIILPGPFELLIDPLILFLFMIQVGRRVRPVNRLVGMGLGVVAAFCASVVITFTDMLIAALLGLGYIYRDQLPWLPVPNMGSMETVLGHVWVALIAVFICMGVVKITAVLGGGLLGGCLFNGKKEPDTLN